MRKERPADEVSIVKAGGSASIIESGVNHDFMKEFIQSIWSSLERYAFVVFVIGGGKRVRLAQKALGEEASTTQKDLLGIEILIEHAESVRNCILEILQENGCTPEEANNLVARTPHNPEELIQVVQTDPKRFIVVSGLVPRQSTDASAVMVGEAFMDRPDRSAHVYMALATNVDALYDKDPNKEYLDSKTPPRRVKSGNIARLAQKTDEQPPILEGDPEKWVSGPNVPLDYRAIALLSQRPFAGIFFGNTENSEDINRFFLHQPVESGTLFVPNDIQTEFYPEE